MYSGRIAKIGIADTMFARGDMGKLAIRTIKQHNPRVVIERYTVPGIKDLPVAAKKLIEEKDCDLVIALGMPGKKKIDKMCAHEASIGIQLVQLMTNKHVLEVFVHEDEARTDKKLASIMRDRTIKHAINALNLLFNQGALQRLAGTGQRQGGPNAKPIKL
jgi:riboflavin synthase